MKHIAARQLLCLLVCTFAPAAAMIDLVIDENLERRWGRKISKQSTILLDRGYDQQV